MISRDQAKQLSSAPEWPLIDHSYPPALERASSAQLREYATQARRLHDKYRELARDQHRSRKAKGSGQADDNARTEQKAQLFEEARERYEARLGQHGDSFPG